MTHQTPGGHSPTFPTPRNVFDSAIWEKPPQYYRLLSWLIGKAVFRDGHAFKGHILKRGELITTHDEIAKALSYRFNRQIMTPTVKEIRIMLSWLQSEGLILMKPITDGTLPNKGRPNNLTRAYIGTLVSVVNYGTYQIYESYKGSYKGRPSSEQGQTEEERRGRKNIFIPPTLEEITAYCRTRGNGVNPQTWLDHYTATGWMIGKNKMKDWKAAVRTWERNDIPQRKEAW